MAYGAARVERVGQDLPDASSARAPADDWPIVVVVDDDACLRALIGDWVEAAGFTSVRVEDGGSCVEAVKFLSPAVVIVDLYMEGMGGVDTISAIRALDRGVYIIAATAETDPEMLIDVAEAGADEVLLKPFNRTVLVKALCSTTGRKALAGPDFT